MAVKFPSEMSSRGTVKNTDKLIIHNIDTGATEYTTVAELIRALAIRGEYADNTAALAGGLVAGDVYRTGDALKIVH